MAEDCINIVFKLNDPVDITDFNAAMRLLGMDKAQTARFLVRNGFAYLPNMIDELRIQSQHSGSIQEKMVGMFDDNEERLQKSKLIVTGKMKANVFYQLDTIDPRIRDVILTYLNLCETFPKLRTSNIANAHTNGVDGSICKKILVCINRPSWDKDLLIAAIHNSPYHNLSDTETRIKYPNWRGATLNWVTSREGKNGPFGYEKLIDDYKREHGTPMQKLMHSEARSKFTDAEIAQLRDVFTKICMEEQLLVQHDNYPVARGKLASVARAIGVEQVVQKIGKAEKSMEALDVEYSKLTK